MQQITTLQYNDQFAVGFTNDAWFNATAVAKNYNKLPNEWLRLESTKEYIMALHAALFPEIQLRDYPVIKQNQLVRTKTGSQENGGGAWFHPKLAVAFARWLDVKFAVWCDLQTEKMLFPKRNGLVEISPTYACGKMQRHIQEMVHANSDITGKHYNTIYDTIKPNTLRQIFVIPTQSSLMTSFCPQRFALTSANSAPSSNTPNISYSLRIAFVSNSLLKTDTKTSFFVPAV